MRPQVRFCTSSVPTLRRLCLALDLAEPAGIYATLLRLPCRLFISSSHIDLSASLQAISLQVRSAGLDRDPGWAPDFGRIIYFHFES